MAGTFALDGEVAAELAAAYGLAAPSAWGDVAAGTINSNHWLVAGGQRYFLRINQGKSETDVGYEARLLGELVSRGVQTPPPLVSTGDQPWVKWRGQLVSLFPWHTGRHRLADEVTPSDARAVGEALATLHAVSMPLVGSFAREGIYTTGHIARRARDLLGDPRSADPALQRSLAVIGEELFWLRTYARDRQRLPQAVIHGDLFRDNVLFGDDGGIVLLDFEQASVGAAVYDLAVCLNAWCFTDRFERPLLAALYRGYTERRALGAIERDLLPVELRAAAVRFLVTRITDVYLPGASLPGKGFDRYLARLEAWRQGGVPMDWI